MPECREQNPNFNDVFSTCVRKYPHPAGHRDGLQRQWESGPASATVLDEIDRHVLDEQALQVARSKIVELEKQVKGLTEENMLLRSIRDTPGPLRKPDPTLLAAQRAVETLTARVIELEDILRSIRKLTRRR
jgi:hypothetical protein